MVELRTVRREARMVPRAGPPGTPSLRLTPRSSKDRVGNSRPHGRGVETRANTHDSATGYFGNSSANTASAVNMQRALCPHSGTTIVV